MTPVLFSFPPQARVGKVVPKSKIYEHGPVSRALRERFVAQVEQITWQYKLAPETINLAASPTVPEIEIFDIAMKGEELDNEILRAIDRAIPLPIIFQLHDGERICMIAAYKRPSEADGSKWVIGDYFAGSWQAVEAARQPLPVALDLTGLYEHLLRSLLPGQALTGESMKEQLERLGRLRVLEREASKLEASLNKEKQFNRKVALNAQLRELKNEIDQLNS